MRLCALDRAASPSQGHCFSPLVARCAKRSSPNEATHGSARVMKSSPAMLALVTDAFGGRGGIAQYNRDFLGALAEAGAVSSDYCPAAASARSPRAAGNDRTNAGAARTDCLFGRSPANCTFPASRSRVLWTPLYGAVSRADRAAQRRKAHRSDPWDRGLAAAVTGSARSSGSGRSRVVCLAPYARSRALMGRDRARAGPRRAEHSEGSVHARRRLDTARCVGRSRASVSS